VLRANKTGKPKVVGNNVVNKLFTAEGDKETREDGHIPTVNLVESF